MDQPTALDRRQFLLRSGAGAVMAAPLLSCSRSEPEPVVRPAGVPIGPFGAESTAEEVTAGIDLTGKLALVTGATSGLGLETARVLAQRGASVIVAGRSLGKAETACRELGMDTQPLALELEQGESIVTAAQSVLALERPIDILVCNAGIMALPQLEQVGGIEKQFAVNHLGHFMLVNRLLPAVEAAAQGRIVIVSSLGYRWAPEAGIEFDNLSGERDYEPNRMYGQSKLANALFSLELARRFRESGSTATANALHPGVINTNLGRHFDAWKRVAASLIGWTFMKSIEEGAATSCYLATAPALSTVSGYYFEDCNPVVPTPGKHMEDLAMAQRLWDVSRELCTEYLV
ncbi:MAG: SDR family NAD(P)-dependent oxidoreductase [Steroidobacteraceae bacterium]|jgi:NAD(P)-dependent dehydrogenase (short-subunit alcohol dehydrogenase family)